MLRLIKPKLPTDDPQPHERELELAKSREIYRFDYSYPKGVALAAELPPEAQFSTCMALEVAKLQMETTENAAASELTRPRGKANQQLRHAIDRVRAIAEPPALAGLLGGQLTAIADDTRPDRPADLADFNKLYPLIERPEVAACFEEDWVFAWQRVAGANPMVLTRMDSLKQSELRLDDALFSRVAEHHYGPRYRESPLQLEEALKNGLLFVADYVFLEKGGATAGEWLGLAKYLYAPVAVFAFFPPIGRFPARLMPILIRLGQAGDTPLVTPLDGHAWMRAKTAVQTADLIWHEARAHLGLTHLVMEAVAVTTERNLAENHPLKLLLAPHYQFTMAINDFAKNHLVCPGGQVDRYMATTIASFIGTSGAALADFDLDEMLPEAELARRKVDDATRLAVYPYRDDMLPLWHAVRKLVDAYVRLYYRDDLAVQGDEELQSWIRELTSRDGGRLKRVPDLDCRDAVAKVFAFFVFTASVQHSAVNYPQWPFMGYAPNMPAGIYAEAAPPSRRVKKGETQWEAAARVKGAPHEPVDWDPEYIAMLPSYPQAMGQLALLKLLSGVRYNHLGKFPPLHFTDLRVLALLRRFNEELRAIETDSRARDANRPMTYPYLFPSNVARSVHI